MSRENEQHPEIMPVIERVEEVVVEYYKDTTQESPRFMALIDKLKEDDLNLDIEDHEFLRENFVGEHSKKKLSLINLKALIRQRNLLVVEIDKKSRNMSGYIEGRLFVEETMEKLTNLHADEYCKTSLASTFLSGEELRRDTQGEGSYRAWEFFKQVRDDVIQRCSSEETKKAKLAIYTVYQAYLRSD